MSGTKNPVRILGGSQTDFARNWKKEGKSFFDMMNEATQQALSNAGMDPGEIARLNKEGRVAFFVGNFDAEQYCKQGHLGGFFGEMNPAFGGVPSARYEAACASGSVAVEAANHAIIAGDYDLAVVLGIEVMKTVSPAEGGDFLGTAAWYEKEAQGVEFPFPKLFGKLKDVIQERYKLDAGKFRNNLSEISRINYDNAKRNPLAQTREWPRYQDDPKTKQKMDMPLGSLTLFDCSQVTDGAAVTLLASPAYAAEWAKKSGKQASKLSGWGHRTAAITFDTKVAESKGNAFILPWTHQAVQDAYKRAGVNVSNVNVFETHDCFTSSEYAAISAFGLTKPGEEHTAIESGAIDFKGKSPINPSGGLIGAGHPVGASGVRMLLDCHRQVTGQAGDYQVAGAKTATMLNIGGSATTSMVFVVQSEG